MLDIAPYSADWRYLAVAITLKLLIDGTLPLTLPPQRLRQTTRDTTLNIVAHETV